MVQQSMKKHEFTEHDNPVSTLSRPGKINSLCKDNTETVLLEKFESSPAALEINYSEFEGVPCIYKPTSKRQKRQLCIPKRNGMKKHSR